MDNFQELVEQAMKESGRAQMRPVVEKELLHYDILFALDKEGLLNDLTFQGGTSLRLCYGAPRYSEDLDFVGGKDFDMKKLLRIKECIEKYISSRYGLRVNVNEPTEKNSELEVHRWKITVHTAPKDEKQQKIRIEVCNVPAYTKVPRTLSGRYEWLASKH